MHFKLAESLATFVHNFNENSRYFISFMTEIFHFMKLSQLPTDNSTVIIYDQNMFINTGHRLNF
jgi:hypothetical protein